MSWISLCVYRSVHLPAEDATLQLTAVLDPLSKASQKISPVLMVNTSTNEDGTNSFCLDTQKNIPHDHQPCSEPIFAIV